MFGRYLAGLSKTPVLGIFRWIRSLSVNFHSAGSTRLTDGGGGGAQEQTPLAVTGAAESLPVPVPASEVAARREGRARLLHPRRWGDRNGGPCPPEAWAAQCVVTGRRLESHTYLGFPAPRCVTLGTCLCLSESGFLTCKMGTFVHTLSA